MKFYGDLDLNQNFLKNVSFENQTEFPAVPKAGQLVFKGKKLYLCAEMNAGQPIWIPLTNEIDTMTHEQSGASTLWDITHSFDDNTVTVQVFDLTGNIVLPDGIDTSTPGHIKISFGVPQAGKAVIIHKILEQSDISGGAGTGDSGTGVSEVGSLFELTSSPAWVAGFDGSTSGSEDTTDPVPGAGDTWDGDGVRLSATRFAFFSDSFSANVPGSVLANWKWFGARSDLNDGNTIVPFSADSDVLTGIPNDATQLFLSFRAHKYDAQWNEIVETASVSFTGSQVQTVADFVNVMNAQLPPTFGTVAFAAGYVSFYPVATDWEGISLYEPAWYSQPNPPGSNLMFLFTTAGYNFGFQDGNANPQKATAKYTVYVYDVNQDNTVTLQAQTPLFLDVSPNDTKPFGIDGTHVLMVVNTTEAVLVRVNADGSVDVLDQKSVSHANTSTTLTQLTSTTFATTFDYGITTVGGTSDAPNSMGGVQLFSVENDVIVVGDFLPVFTSYTGTQEPLAFATSSDYTPPHQLQLTDVRFTQCARLDDTHAVYLVGGELNVYDAGYNEVTPMTKRGYAFLIDTQNLTVSAPITVWDGLDSSGSFDPDDPNSMISLGDNTALFTTVDMNNGDFLTVLPFKLSGSDLLVGTPTVADARDSYYNLSVSMLGLGQAIIATDTGYYDNELGQSFDRITTTVVKVEPDLSIIAGTPVDWAVFNNDLDDPARLVTLDSSHVVMIYNGYVSGQGGILVPRVLYQA